MIYGYPVRGKGFWKIHREYNGVHYTYEKSIKVIEQSKAVNATYINLAKKL